jgi:hypothetical protein
MPRTTKAQTQSDLLYVAENIMTASVLLEDDPHDTDLFGMEEEEDDFWNDDVSDVLDLAALNWMAIAQSMSGDGSRGTYDQIPKSADFCTVCLQAPAREFRHMFRSIPSSSIRSSLFLTVESGEICLITSSESYLQTKYSTPPADVHNVTSNIS